jgi:hypothetical protein
MRTVKLNDSGRPVFRKSFEKPALCFENDREETMRNYKCVSFRYLSEFTNPPANFKDLLSNAKYIKFINYGRYEQ